MAYRIGSSRLILLLTAVAALSLLGCGPVTYSIDVNEAERVVAEARADNAIYYAPYDLHFAEAHLEKAHEEAAQGQYEDAIHAVAVALAYGRRALTRSAQPGVSDR
jgi:hypothetical protein